MDSKRDRTSEDEEQRGSGEALIRDTREGSPALSADQQSTEVSVVVIPKEAQVNNDALFVAICHSRRDYIRVLLKRTDALRLVQYKDPKFLENALHQACRRKTPLDIVERIVDLDPLQVAQQNRNGYSPLHMACYHSSEDIVMLMLRLAPDTAKVSTTYGDLPLHWAVSYKRSPAIIRRLLTIYPTAVYRESSDEKNVLSYFINRWTRDTLRSIPPGNHLDGNIDGLTIVTDILILLLKAHVNGTLDEREALARKWLPLHEALKIKEITIPSQFLRILDYKIHNECVTPDNDRNFPLHLACAFIPTQEPHHPRSRSQPLSSFEYSPRRFLPHRSSRFMEFRNLI